ncbi:MAG: PDZ domain-containing protein [Candidatus Omnitrophica bacterium]|nr:PDZ domain-containing protein [Candidatus Omnitrophota bacterium]
MKRETTIAIFGLLFITLLILAICNHQDVQTAAEEAFHEITTSEIWQQTQFAQAAYPCPIGGNQQAAFSQYPNLLGEIQPPLEIVNPEIIQQGFQPAAVTTAPPIYAGQEKPALIKEMGAEVIAIGGGKVKVTGVMGGSWAQKAGLVAGDILLSFDSKKITSLAHFKDIVSKAPPEKDYKISYLRNGRKKQGMLTIGEGEMEGFTPIPAPK